MQRNRGEKIEWKRLELSSRKLEIPRPFHAKMGTIKNRNRMDLTEAEILRRGGKARYMRQVLRPGALGRPREIRWRGRCEGGSGWGIHVNPWLIYVNVWQKLLQYCKVISLQLIKINGGKKKKRWQEDTEKLYKKDLHDQDNHDGVITRLEPDTLECQVKWALEASLRTKLVEVMEFQLAISNLKRWCH